MKILLFIGSLASGGAERQLAVLAKGLATRGHVITVVTLYSGGQIADEIRGHHAVSIIPLYPSKSNALLIRLLQLLYTPFKLRKMVINVDCIYSMLEVTNLIAWCATRGKQRVKLVWGVRSSNVKGHWKMSLFDRMCVLISPTVGMLIVNSFVGLTHLLDRGYRARRNEVILNGVDTAKFRYSEAGRVISRNENGISAKHYAVGMVGRLDPMKDHENFIKAAAILIQSVDNIKFLCVGGGSGSYLSRIQSLVSDFELDEHFIWLGNRSDLVALYSSFDVFVSSSAYGEGFSNVIGEAMSCGVPCVVTDVGDSAEIVGDLGSVIAPYDSVALAQAICLELEGNINSRALLRRSRMENNFSIEKFVESSEAILREYRAIGEPN